MRKQEKTQRTKERIFAAALLEFGTKSYDAASINSICETGQIPKGLLYHNFKGKDELYLRCVKACYDELTATLKKQSSGIQDVKERMQSFLMMRQRFFQANPCYANIFFNAALQPPKHLKQELLQLRREFDEYFNQCYLAIVDSLILRDGITKETALEYFWLASEMFNGYFQNKAEQNGSYRELIQAREGRLSEIFDIMLYGIAKEPIKMQHEDSHQGAEETHKMDLRMQANKNMERSNEKGSCQERPSLLPH